MNNLINAYNNKSVLDLSVLTDSDKENIRNEIQRNIGGFMNNQKLQPLQKVNMILGGFFDMFKKNIESIFH